MAMLTCSTSGAALRDIGNLPQPRSASGCRRSSFNSSQGAPATHRAGRADATSVSRRAATNSSPAPLHAHKVEVHVCTNKTCTKQGSKQVLQFAKDLALDDVEAHPSGCLGKCGAGPNIMIMPQDRVLHHVATPTDLADALGVVCGLEVTPDVLHATQLRLAGNALATDGELEKAVSMYSKGLALGLQRGQHLLYSNRSAALLQLGRREEALHDAQRAVELAPPSFLNGWLRLVDSHYALGHFKEAGEVAARMCAAVPDVKGTKQHMAIIQALGKEGVRL